MGSFIVRRIDPSGTEKVAVRCTSVDQCLQVVESSSNGAAAWTIFLLERGQRPVARWTVAPSGLLVRGKPARQNPRIALGPVVKALCRWSGYHHVSADRWDDRGVLAQAIPRFAEVTADEAGLDRQFWGGEFLNDLEAIYGRAEVVAAVEKHCPVLAWRAGLTPNADEERVVIDYHGEPVRVRRVGRDWAYYYDRQWIPLGFYGASGGVVRGERLLRAPSRWAAGSPRSGA